MSLTVLPTYGKKKFSVSKIPGSLNLKFTFQFDHSSKPLYSFENCDPSTITKRGICGALAKKRHEKNRGSKQQRSISRTPPASEINTELTKWRLPAHQCARH